MELLIILEAAYDSFHASRRISQKRFNLSDHCIGSDRIVHNRVQKCPQTKKIYIFIAINYCGVVIHQLFASLTIKRKQIFYQSQNHRSTATFSIRIFRTVYTWVNFSGQKFLIVHRRAVHFA